MKKILITRHAEASSSSNLGTDFSRPLTELGLRDCQLIGKELENKNFRPDLSIISSSIRTIQTYENLSKFLNLESNKLDIKDSLYNIGFDDFISMLKIINSEFKSVMVVGHNPTMSIFTKKYSDSKINQFPPGSSALFSCDISSWGLIDENLKFEYFIKPEDFR